MNQRPVFVTLRSYLQKRDGIKVSPERIVIIVLALALMFSLGVQMGQAQGRAPAAPPVNRPASPATAFADSIPVQGRLTNASGSPLTGVYTMTYNIYNVPSAGSSLCASTTAVTVTNGLWNATIDDCGGGSGLFAGGDTQMYVGIKVGTDAEMTPRQPLFAVPYAQGLLTPLEVSGNSTSPILTVLNNGTGRAANLTGNSSSAILNVTNSSGGVAANFGGDVTQPRLNSGLVKAGALVLCASAGSFTASVYRSFNDVNNTAVTIVGGASLGKCTVDFGFQISGIGNAGRYYVASPRSPLAQSVSCGENITNTKLDCFYYDSATGLGADGDIEILVY